MPGEFPRKVRSFVKRGGRMTVSQARALDSAWPVYGISFAPKPLDVAAVFGRAAPVVLEIGFGDGDTFVEQAASDPERNYLGIEVHEPGIGHCLLQLEAQRIDNARVMNHDAVEVLRHAITDASLARVNLYFSDPWPKKRHHKRRLVQADFLALVARKLAADGELFIATDWANYAEHIDEAIAASGAYTVVERVRHVGDRPLDRPTTKFERRGLRRGHEIWDWQLRKKSSGDA